MTTKRKEQERAAFEDWYTDTYLPTPVHGRTFNAYPSGTYCLQHVQDAWQAWQGRARGWISIIDDLPPLDTPVWGGWWYNCRFEYGLFVLSDTGAEGGAEWCLCETTTSYTDFAGWLNDDVYPVTHWQYLPRCPAGSAFRNPITNDPISRKPD